MTQASTVEDLAFFGVIGCLACHIWRSAQRYQALEPAPEVTTWQENSAPALPTANADVGPQAHDLPLVAAARMGLAQSDNVAEVKLQRCLHWHATRQTKD